VLAADVAGVAYYPVCYRPLLATRPTKGEDAANTGAAQHRFVADVDAKLATLPVLLPFSKRYVKLCVHLVPQQKPPELVGAGCSHQLLLESLL
jgi:hypothetical protein